MERKWHEETCKAGLSHVERWRKGKREGEECPDVQSTESKYLCELNSSPSSEGMEKYATISELSAALGKESRQAETLAHVALRQIGVSVQLCQKHLNNHPVVVAVSSQLNTVQNAMERAEEARSHLVQLALMIMQWPFSGQEKGIADGLGLEGEEGAQGVDVRDGLHWKKKAEELSVIVEELQRELKISTEENRVLRCGNDRSPALLNKDSMEQDYSSLIPRGEQRYEAGLTLDKEPKCDRNASEALAELNEVQAEPQKPKEYCTEPPKQHAALSPSITQEKDDLSRRPVPLETVEREIQETTAPETSLERESYTSANEHAELLRSSTHEENIVTKPSTGLLYSLGRWVVGSNEPGDQGDDDCSPVVV